MLYLLLKQSHFYPSMLDVSLPQWSVIKLLEAETLHEAVDKIPDDGEGIYQLYEVKSEPIEVRVKVPKKLEKVWDSSPKSTGEKHAGKLAHRED